MLTLFAANFCEWRPGRSRSEPTDAHWMMTYLCETSAVKRVLLGLRRGLLAQPGIDSVRVITVEMGAITGTCLAYAARHCSSRRAFAASMSFWETKREPTPSVEMDGMASSMRRGLRGGGRGNYAVAERSGDEDRRRRWWSPDDRELARGHGRASYLCLSSPISTAPPPRALASPRYPPFLLFMPLRPP